MLQSAEQEEQEPQQFSNFETACDASRSKNKEGVILSNDNVRPLLYGSIVLLL